MFHVFVFSAEGESVCTICDAGYACPDPASSEVACTEGYFSAEGADNCTRCANNEISNALHTACDPCPAGKSCSDPTLMPSDCSAGDYAMVGDGVCQSCPAGSRCPTTSSVEACPAGNESLVSVKFVG